MIEETERVFRCPRVRNFEEDGPGLRWMSPDKMSRREKKGWRCRLDRRPEETRNGFERRPVDRLSREVHTEGQGRGW